MAKNTKNIEEVKEKKETTKKEETVKKEKTTKKDTATKKEKNNKKDTKTTKGSNKKSDVDKKIKENPVEEMVEKITKPIIKKSRPQRDMNELIQVICITNTPLVYESKTQLGYRVEWDGYLQENWMEFKELINMRSSQRAFFEEPWIICDWDVLVDLKVDRYYKNIIDLENLDGLFKKSPKELEKILKMIPRGIKRLVVDKAFELRRAKKLDSISIIEVIEKTLDIDLSV